MTEAFGGGRTVTIGNKTFIVKPLTLNDLVELESVHGKGWSGENSVTVTRHTLWLHLRKQQPELTVEDVGELFAQGNLDEIEAVLSLQKDDREKNADSSQEMLMEGSTGSTS